MCSHEGFIKYVWDYGASHVHWTSRLRLGSWTSSYNDGCEKKQKYVQLEVAYCKANVVLT